MRVFRPPWWAWVVSLAGIAFFAAMAQWQWQRGQDKADIIARRAAAAQAPPQAVAAAADLPAFGRRIAVTGHWQPAREVLLDNQTHEQAVGVHVWTPLRLQDDGALLLSDRGWRKTAAYRDRLPDTGELPAASVTVSGQWRSLPRAGIEPPASACLAADTWPQRLSYPDARTLRCRYAEPVIPGLLLLDAAQPDGYVRDWLRFGIGPERHYAYAVQWGALGLTVLVLFLVLNLRRTNA